MSLADILAAIRADTEAEIADVRSRARGEMFAIEEQARIDAKRGAAAILRAADVGARHEADQIVIRARSTVEHRLAAAAEEVYQETLAQVRGELAELRGTPRYRIVLGVLLDESLGRLPKATIVSVGPSDASLLEELMEARTEATQRVDTSLASIGGVSVATNDGRTVHNTFEIRIRKADGMLRAIAASHLVAAERSE